MLHLVVLRGSVRILCSGINCVLMGFYTGFDQVEEDIKKDFKGFYEGSI